MVQYTLEQRIFCITPTWNMDLLESVGRNFDVNFMMKEFPADRQFTIWWINLISSTLNRQETNTWALTTYWGDDIGARLEHAPGKSLKHLSQETIMSKSSARRTTQLLKLRTCKTTVIHALQLHDPASMVYFCIWFLQSSRVRLIHSWHSFLMKRIFTCRDT
jgi:hypothetical protein